MGTFDLIYTSETYPNSFVLSAGNFSPALTSVSTFVWIASTAKYGVNTSVVSAENINLGERQYFSSPFSVLVGQTTGFYISGVPDIQTSSRNFVALSGICGSENYFDGENFYPYFQSCLSAIDDGDAVNGTHSVRFRQGGYNSETTLFSVASDYENNYITLSVSPCTLTESVSYQHVSGGAYTAYNGEEISAVNAYFYFDTTSIGNSTFIFEVSSNLLDDESAYSFSYRPNAELTLLTERQHDSIKINVLVEQQSYTGSIVWDVAPYRDLVYSDYITLADSTDLIETITETPSASLSMVLSTLTDLFEEPWSSLSSQPLSTLSAEAIVLLNASFSALTGVFETSGLDALYFSVCGNGAYITSYTVNVSTYADDIDDYFMPYIEPVEGGDLLIEVGSTEYINRETITNLNLFHVVGGVKSNIPEDVYVDYTHTPDDSRFLVLNYMTGSEFKPINSSRACGNNIYAMTYLPDFSVIPPMPTTFDLHMSVRTGSGVTLTGSYSALSAYNWPSENLLSCNFKINNNNETFYKEWSATDVVKISNHSKTSYVDSGKWVVEHNSTVSSFNLGVVELPVFSITSPTPNSEYPFTVSLSGIKYKNTPHTYELSTDISIFYLDPMPSLDFIVYPDKVWDSGTRSMVSVTDPYTQSLGASGYGSGNTILFHLSAVPSAGYGYSWSVDNEPLIENTNEVLYRFNTKESQSGPQSRRVTCQMYDNLIAPNSPHFCYNISGSPVEYPFYQETDNSEVLNQDMVAYPIDAASRYIDQLVMSAINMPYEDQITVAYELLDASLYSEIMHGRFTWFMSTDKWTHSECSTDISDLSAISHTFQPLVYGDGWSPLTISPDSDTTTLYVYLTGMLEVFYQGTNSKKLYFDTRDNNTTNLISVVNSYGKLSIPNTFFSLTESGSSVDVVVHNMTNQTDNISGYVLTDGLTSVTTFEASSNFAFTYSAADVYDMELTVWYVDGRSFSYFYNDFFSVISQFDEYTEDITRVAEYTTLELPYTQNDILISPNEFITADTINSCFEKLNANLTYMDNMTKMYNSPSVKYLSWFGKSSFTEGEKWHSNLGDNFAVSYATFFDVLPGTLYNVRGCVEDGNKIYAINSDSLVIMTDTVSGMVVEQTDVFESNNSFVDLCAISIDTEKNIVVLDKTKNLVASYDQNLELNYSWGGLGGQTAKYKFRSPSDLVVDMSDNSIWVVDGQNGAIKHFTNTGSWRGTVVLPEGFNAISMSIGINDIIHIMDNAGTILKYTKDGEQVGSFTYQMYGTPKKIVCASTGFIYICFESTVIRYLDNGTFSGEFDAVYGIIDYRSISYNNETRNLFVSNIFNILKYTDFPQIYDVKDEYALWPISGIYIKEDEYVQDWVYNKSFSRFWENLEIFKRSLKGRLGFVEEVTDIMAPYVSAELRVWKWKDFRLMPECLTWNDIRNDVNNYTWDKVQGFDSCSEWIAHRYQDGLQTLEYKKYTPVVFNFSPDDVMILPYQKEDILIGINELVTYEVFNRCFGQLFEDEKTIFALIKDK